MRDNKHDILPDSRREFIKKTALATTGLPIIQNTKSLDLFPDPMGTGVSRTTSRSAPTSIIGGYGEWAASLLKDPPKLSFRNPKWPNLEKWRKKALEKASSLIAEPDIQGEIIVTVEKEYVYDGLEIEELSWQLPYGNPTKGILLKPEGNKKPLPGILALHDHGGKKYFGKRKITRISDDVHPLIKEHQDTDYGGRAWANEIAKRGYVVLVHDTFAFGSRRVLYEDVEGIDWGFLKIGERSDENPDDPENIQTYNAWAAEHEHVLQKSLLSAGTTMSGVVLAEDRVALGILARRPDVDQKRIGCGGLSGGGLRTVFLGGMDSRIKCAVCVGFMSTWNDFVLHKSYTHTWMAFPSTMSRYLDFPEILGLRVPMPTLVQNNGQDDLYTLPEMKKADEILSEVYKKAGGEGKYQAGFYKGPHKFDATMQTDAFDWFDKWLK